MNDSDTRISTYLDDLARMLGDLDRGERDEVLGGVREHLEATLAEHPHDPAAVDSALLRLGPPERVAAEARADIEAPMSTAPPPPRHPRRVRVASLLSLVALGLPVAMLILARGVLVVSSGREALQTSATALLPHLSEVVLAMVWSFPLWVITIIIATVSVGLSTRSKVVLVALGPLTTAVALVTALSDSAAVAAWLALATLLALLLVIALTARTVWRETRY